MKIRYYVAGVDILSEDTLVVAQSTSYWFVTASQEYMPEFNRNGEVLLAVRKCQTPVEVHDFAGDDPPRIEKYFQGGYVANIIFHCPSLDHIN